MTESSPIATIALRQLQLRRARPVPDHEARLRPWAALALRAGAEPADVSPDAPAALEDYRKAGLSDQQARACLADDLCPLSEARAELARARDAAFDALTAVTTGSAPTSTADLAVLAVHFGCPPWQFASAPKLEQAA